MIVVDASALVDLTAVRAHRALRARLREGDLHAPHLVDVEFTNALRGLVARGDLSADDAAQARADAAALSLTRYPHPLLVERAWELRHVMSAYDGVYVALAELLPAPLITCDARLARTAGHDAVIEVFAPER